MSLYCPLCRLSLPSAGLESHLRSELAYFAWRCGRCSFRFHSRADAVAHYADRFSPHRGEAELIVESRDEEKHARLEQLFDEALAAAQERPTSSYKELRCRPTSSSVTSLSSSSTKVAGHHFVAASSGARQGRPTSSYVAAWYEAAERRPPSQAVAGRYSVAALSEGQPSAIPHLGIDDSESFCSEDEDSEAELERMFLGSEEPPLESTALEAHTSQDLSTLDGDLPRDESHRSSDELVSFDDTDSEQVLAYLTQDPATRQSVDISAILRPSETSEISAIRRPSDKSEMSAILRPSIMSEQSAILREAKKVDVSTISQRSKARRDFGNIASYREQRSPEKSLIHQISDQTKDEQQTPQKTGFAPEMSYLSPGHEDPSPQPQMYIDDDVEGTSETDQSSDDLYKAAAPTKPRQNMTATVGRPKKMASVPKKSKPSGRQKSYKTKNSKPKTKKGRDTPTYGPFRLSRSVWEASSSEPNNVAARLSQSVIVQGSVRPAQAKFIRQSIPKSVTVRLPPTPPPSEYHLPDAADAPMEGSFGKFTCRLCSVLQYKQNFASHAFNIHMAVKAFSCRLCPVQSRVKVTMVGHLRRVHGVSASSANYANGLPGLRRKELPALVRRCFGEDSESDYARVPCPGCDKSVTLQGALDHVAWDHVRQRTFACALCPFTDMSYRRSKINGHLRNVHRRRARAKDVVDTSAGPKALVRAIHNKLFGQGKRTAV